MSSDHNLVSVIVPTWNRADLIGAAISSVLEQTHDELELLVCDDGSTDATEEIVRSISDPRVRWRPGPRAGRPAPPRNRGIEASSGGRVAFLDSDDTWAPRKLEAQLKAMDELDVKAACSNANRIVNGENTGERFIYWNRPRITFRDLLAGNVVINSSVVMDRSLFPQVLGFPEAAEMTALEDYALWMRTATLTDIAYCDECLVFYRDDPIESVRKNQLEIFQSRRMVSADFKSWAQHAELDPKYVRMANLWYLYGLSNPSAIAINALKKFQRTYLES